MKSAPIPNKTLEQSGGPLPSELRPPRIGVNFTEAAGKTVAYINYACHFPEWIALQVKFTDGTSFSFQLNPQVNLRVEYLESRHGELEVLRDYGTISAEGRRSEQS